MAGTVVRERFEHLRGTERRQIGVPPEQGGTIVHALLTNGKRHADLPAMRYRPAGQATGKPWEVVTWGEYLLAARQVAGGLAELGVEPGERVAILSANCVEWHLADLGGLANGSVTVPIYPTSSPSQIAYLLGHAGVRVCFVDTHTQLGKVIEVRDELPALERLVLADGARRKGDSFVISLDDLRALGADRLSRAADAVDERCKQVRPEDVATIVYTSGTTGPPKGALISHSNIMWTLRQVTPVYNIGQGERLLSFLPLSHIAERMMSDFLPIAVRGETWFARSLATVAEDLPACRPTVFLAVPRVWEKLREGIEEHLRAEPAPVRLATERYVSLGLRKVSAQQLGRSLPTSGLAVHRALNATIGSTIRQKLGLDRAHVLVTAAAPAHPDLISWFHAIDLPVLQIYGQTEGCGPTSATYGDHVRIGTVGTALPGMSVRIADDGEILLKGGNVCLGYLDDPMATGELIDPDGWMHTGDTGTFDGDGSLRIVGRKKDLIITAAGHNVAPQVIETELCNHPLISEAVVVGDGRKYLVALITLDPEELTHWAEEHNKLAQAEALAEDHDLLSEIQAAVDSVNEAGSHADGIRKFRVLAHDLSAAAGELTPTLKVRRAMVCAHYADVIEELYAGS
ncbi:MAG: AMP-dependent synthetase/ligase [Acidimicrobiales bacterium]|jgi:long-chain acyl-CoA synthetase